MRFGPWFDERFRDAAGGVFAFSPFRLGLGAFVTAFVSLGAGVSIGLIWAGAALLAEAAMLTTTRQVLRAERPDGPEALRCAAVYAVAIPTWSLAGLLLWSAPSTASHLAAAAFFAGHLLYIQAQHAHSPGAALPAAPAVVVPALAPLLIPHFHGVEQAVVCLAMAAVALNAAISLGVSLAKSLDLLEAQAATAAASQAKSDFLARMSHEIRTPLNGVLGMAQALAGAADLPPQHRRSVGVIRQSGESLLAILNDVLDLSKVEAGRLELEAIAFDLAATARSAHETFAAQAETKGLAFRLHIDPGAAGLYRGDPTRLRQILCNLLSNAVKFTDAGEVLLSIGRGAAGAVEIVVADSGPGLAPTDLARLFRRYQQADASTGRRFGGTGLGLSICRELAELMGGSITAESSPGQGSRFVVLLPLPRADDDAPPDAEVDGPEGEEIRPLRILAAEDNPVNQLVLRTLLGQAGLDVTLVDDGAAAVEAWRAGAFDLVLMDVQMPVLDGVAATRRIRGLEAAEGRPRVPILALTADVMAHQVASYAEAGLDGWIGKPIDSRQLYEAIAAAAPEARLETAAA